MSTPKKPRRTAARKARCKSRAEDTLLTTEKARKKKKKKKKKVLYSQAGNDCAKTHTTGSRGKRPVASSWLAEGALS